MKYEKNSGHKHSEQRSTNTRAHTPLKIIKYENELTNELEKGAVFLWHLATVYISYSYNFFCYPQFNVYERTCVRVCV